MNKILSLKKWLLILPFAGAVGSTLTSCVKRDLVVKSKEGMLEVAYNWSKVVEGSPVPQKMHVYVYNGDGTQLLKEGVSDGSKYREKFATGTYMVLVHNTDCSNVTFEGTSEGYHAARVEALPYTKAGGLYQQPQWVYASGLGQVTVNTGDTVYVEPVMAPLVKSVRMNIVVTGDHEFVQSVEGVLSGVVSAVNLATGQRIEGRIGAVPVLTQKSEDGKTYVADVLLFDVERGPSGEPVNNKLTLDMGLSNGSSARLDLDLDEAFANGNFGEKPIEVNIDTEVKQNPQVGFEAHIVDWSYGEIEIGAVGRNG